MLVEKLGAVLVKKNITFGGFGGETQGNIYRIHFELNGLYYLDMPIVASRLMLWHLRLQTVRGATRISGKSL